MGFLLQHWVIALWTLVVLAIVVASYLRRPVSPKKAANWPVAEATIQSVDRVGVHTGQRYIDVGEFSYTVNDEYYSGKLRISRSFSTHDGSPGDLVNQKIQVRYDPAKPEQFSVPQAEIGGFLLDPYRE
jgi:hypothetical protein